MLQDGSVQWRLVGEKPDVVIEVKDTSGQLKRCSMNAVDRSLHSKTSFSKTTFSTDITAASSFSVEASKTKTNMTTDKTDASIEVPANTEITINLLRTVPAWNTNGKQSSNCWENILQSGRILRKSSKMWRLFCRG